MRERERRVKELNKPKSKAYLWYLLFILTLVYITDEIASQIGAFMKTPIANDMLESAGNSSVGVLDLLSMISVPFMVLGVFYKPLADRFGRKPFLVINTFGMALGLLIIYSTGLFRNSGGLNLGVYVAGASVIQFFVPHDMQAVYIFETAPAKHRARIYSVIKATAMLGVMLIPLLRFLLMKTPAEWRRVYIIPTVIGLAVSVFALFFAKETDAFNAERINAIDGKSGRKEDGGSPGFIAAIKYVIKNRQLRWLFIALALSETGFILTINYETIITYGYAECFFSRGLFDTMELAVSSVTVNETSKAIFLFPVGCALGQFVPGFISDKISRKAACLVMSVSAVMLLIGFTFGAKYGVAVWVVGLLCGACIGTFWSNVDTLNMIVGESSPTYLRSSIISAANLATGLGIGIAYGVYFLMTFAFGLGNDRIWIIALASALPGLIGAFVILVLKVRDTTGADLSVKLGEKDRLLDEEE